MQGSKESPDSAKVPLRKAGESWSCGLGAAWCAKGLSPLGSLSPRASPTKPDGVRVVLGFILTSADRSNWL